MSEQERENVELVRRIFETWNRGEIEDVLELLHTDVELRPNRDLPDVEPDYHGRDGARRFFREFREPWEKITIEPLETRARGDEVVMLVRFQAMGRDGIEVDISISHRYTARDGQLVAFRSYADHTQALADAGID